MGDMQNCLLNAGSWLNQLADWEAFQKFLNSSFTSSLFGSLSGAFAGAWFAGRIAEGNKRRNELLIEIRETNATITMAYAICNGGLILKSQLVGPIWRKYQEDQKSHLEALGARQGSCRLSYAALG